MSTSYRYLVKAARVVDGDTYRLTVDLGFRLTSEIDVRLFGYDCPEKRSSATRRITTFEKAQAIKAAEMAEQWFNVWLASESVHVETQPDVEKYGRWLGTITSGVHVVLGLYLEDLGLAVPYMATPGDLRWYQVHGGAQ